MIDRGRSRTPPCPPPRRECRWSRDEREYKRLAPMLGCLDVALHGSHSIYHRTLFQGRLVVVAKVKTPCARDTTLEEGGYDAVCLEFSRVVDDFQGALGDSYCRTLYQTPTMCTREHLEILAASVLRSDEDTIR